MALEEHLIGRYGTPDIIHSDQGSQFTSDYFRAAMKEYGILCTVTPAYNPKSNPVERCHRSLGNMLRALLQEFGNDWSELTQRAVFAINTARSETTGVSPYECLFARAPATTLNTCFGGPPVGPPTQPKSFQKYLTKHRAQIDRIHAYVRENLQTAVVRQRRRYNLETPAFKPGAAVWLWTPKTTPGVSRKLAVEWSGPWKILQKLNEVMYRLQPPLRCHLTRASLDMSVDRLKLFVVDPDNVPDFPPLPGQDLTMAGDEHAEGPLPPPSSPPPPPDPYQDSDDDDDGPPPRPGFGGGHGGGGGGPPAGGGGGPPPFPHPHTPSPVGTPPPPVGEQKQPLLSLSQLLLGCLDPQSLQEPFLLCFTLLLPPPRLLAPMPQMPTPAATTGQGRENRETSTPAAAATGRRRVPTTTRRCTNLKTHCGGTTQGRGQFSTAGRDHHPRERQAWASPPSSIMPPLTTTC